MKERDSFESFTQRTVPYTFFIEMKKSFSLFLRTYTFLATIMIFLLYL